ncbi:MAG: DUF2691 family protein [Clostridia bacterium]|nr:DUF2691 family protein [Clostridia bacterium]
MLRGIEFEDNEQKFFSNLHTLMDIEKYDWYVDDVDLNYFHFRPGKYTGKEFAEALETVSSLSFVRIWRFPLDTNEVLMKKFPMNKYEDFVKNTCDFLILFYDGGFCEIYSKDERLTEQIMELCKRNHYEKVEYKYDYNDARTGMSF